MKTKIIKYVFISIAMIVLFTGCSSEDSAHKENSDITATNLTIEETKEFIKQEEDILILDVRTSNEYDEGHIEGAFLIPLDELENRLDEIDEYKDKPLLVYCRSGNRSKQAIIILLDNDFSQVYHMEDGYMNWE